MTGIQRAVYLIGSQNKLAKASGIAQSTVFLAIKRGYCSYFIACKIYKACNGAVTIHELTSPRPIRMGRKIKDTQNINGVGD